MNYFSKPYNFLTAAGALIFVFSLLTTSKSFDLHIYDTYYVIGMRQWLTMLALVLVALWTIYKLFENILTIRSLVIIHVAASIITIFILLVPPFAAAFANPRVSETSGSLTQYERFNRLNEIVLADVTVFLAAQLLLLVHLILGFVRRFKK